MLEFQTQEGLLTVSPLHVVAIRSPRKNVKPPQPVKMFLDGLGWVDINEKYSSVVEKVEDEIYGFERVERKKSKG